MSGNLFHNVLNQRKYIQEVCDPKTGKHYNVHIDMCVPESGLLTGLIACDFSITTPDPHCNVQVGFGHKAFIGDEFDSFDDFVIALDTQVNEELPKGIKRFEAIMASGIKGNEFQS